jgi:hypothetical protein
MRLERQQQTTLDASGNDWMDCAYRNSSDRMVILRCCGPRQFFLERVVFPFEMLLFACPPQSELEIWSHGLGGAELIEALQAEELRLESPPEHNEAAVDSDETVPWWVQAG